MKWRILVIVALVLVASFAASPAMAGAPDVQPWMYAAAINAGFGTVENVQVAFGNWQNSQAVFHQYKAADWALNYERDVSEFLSRHGCATCWINAFVPSPKLRIDIPIAMCDFRAICWD